MRFVLATLAAFFLGAEVGGIFLAFLERRAACSSWWKEPYRCASCGHTLCAWDCIPVFSYLRSDGHCCYCDAKYPVTTILSELVCGASFASAFIMALLSVQEGDIPCAVAKGMVMILLGLGAVNDIYSHECELPLLFGILVIGVLYAFFFAPKIWNLTFMALVMALLYGADRLYCKLKGLDFIIGKGDIFVLSGCCGVIHSFTIPIMLVITFSIGMLSTPLAVKNQKVQGTYIDDEPGIALLPFAVIGVLTADLCSHLI